MGGLRGHPVELVRCETIPDLYVPATAEIILEGYVSIDFSTFKDEGPFGEYTGYYVSDRGKRPVFTVQCITFRNDPIFQGTMAGIPINEDHRISSVSHSALVWDLLEERMRGITGVNVDPSTGYANVFVQIDNSYYGQVHQVAANIWSAGLSTTTGKNIFVFDTDVDIYDLSKVMWAFAYRVYPPKDIIQYPGWASLLDPIVISSEERSMPGVAKGIRLLIDATKPIDNPKSDRWFGQKFAPLAYPDEETMEQVKKKWKEYGIG
jgi:UbiD family decarboxylase